MATGRIGVTPVLRVRWSDQPTAGTTSLSGLDDNSVALVYDAGYEAVYRNGVLLSRGNDYTATNGTTITLIDATIAGDIIEVFANDLVPLTDAIGKGQYNAKGALLSASAAATPGVVAVGANGTVLTADSAEVTGLKWATPAAGGGMTLLSTTAITAASTISITGIDQTYNQLVIVMSNAATVATDNNSALQFNSDTGTNYTWGAYELINGTQSGSANTSEIRWLQGATTTTNVNNIISVITIARYADTTPNKLIQINTTYIGGTSSARKALTIVGSYRGTSGISSIQYLGAGGQNFTAQGNIFIYGVK